MARLGAKNIIAVSRSGGISEQSIELSKRMQSLGVNLLIHSLDITDIEQVRRVHEITKGKPINGIIQGAMTWNVSCARA